MRSHATGELFARMKADPRRVFGLWGAFAMTLVVLGVTLAVPAGRSVAYVALAIAVFFGREMAIGALLLSVVLTFVNSALLPGGAGGSGLKWIVLGAASLQAL